jgi:hypothetical protein
LSQKLEKAKDSLESAVHALEKHGQKITEFLFGTPSTEIMRKGIEALFPSNDLREKTRLSPRDLRACLFLLLAGKWRSSPFGDVADEFMELEISRDGLGREEMTQILALSNLIQQLPKELSSKLLIRGKDGGEDKSHEKNKNAD